MLNTQARCCDQSLWITQREVLKLLPHLIKVQYYEMDRITMFALPYTWPDRMR